MACTCSKAKPFFRRTFEQGQDRCHGPFVHGEDALMNKCQEPGQKLLGARYQIAPSNANTVAPPS